MVQIRPSIFLSFHTVNLNAKFHLPYFRYYKMVLYLFLRLFGASSIQMGLVFEWVLYLTSSLLSRHYLQGPPYLFVTFQAFYDLKR